MYINVRLIPLYIHVYGGLEQLLGTMINPGIHIYVYIGRYVLK